MKPTKNTRPGVIRRRAIKAAWPKLRDEFKRETQNPDGSWTCIYCKNPIWTWEECVVAHIQPVGRRPDLRLDKNNYGNSHAECNLTSSKFYDPHRD